MADAAVRPWALRLLAAATTVPVILCFAAHVLGTTPTPVAPGPTRGSLVLDQYLVDLGQVPATQDVVGYFDFTNRGSRPLEIVELIPSCGCLRPRLEKLERRTPAPGERFAERDEPSTPARRIEKRVYEPGEGGFFSVRVQTANQSPGQKEYTIRVKYRDPEPHEALVVFRVVLPNEQVLVRPIALMFYQLGDGGGPAAPQEFEVIDRRTEHLKISKVECSRQDIRIEAGESNVDEVGVWHGRFQVTAPDQIAPGQTEAIVRIYTDDPADQYRVLRIPLYLVGPSSGKPGDGKIMQTSGTRTSKASGKPARKMRLPH